MARLLGGEVVSGQVLCPGPRHSAKDRSLAVKPGDNDIVVFSHADDDQIECKDYVRQKLGLPRWEPKPKATTSNKPRFIASYIYKQRDGTPYLRVSRTEPKGPFPQSHWNGVGWTSGKPKGPKIPYRLPEMLAAEDAPVFVVEGEKDVDNLAGHGFTATTNSEGAGCWTVELNPHFTGRTVFILADNDQAGSGHASDVASHLYGTARDIRIVHLPGLAPKGDVSDWLAAGNDAGALIDICQATEVYDPTSYEAEPPLDEQTAPKRRKKHTHRGENDHRPVVRIIAGAIEEIVDKAEAALIQANRGLYQRANQIVSVGEAPIVTASQREVTTLRIFERGEHALAEDLATAALVEKYDARAEDFVTVNPPSWVVKTLQQRLGRLRFPVLSGIINAPTIRPDGSLLSLAGYDKQTGLLFDPRGTEFPPVPSLPSKADARRALEVLDSLIATFPFVAESDRSVALSAILTACVRRSLRTAPLHAFTAPVAGSGKSKLVDIASVIATGREAGVVAQGKTEEEMEKRLGSLFLAGDAVIAIDNCEMPLGGEFLCQALTQTVARVRILGKSEAPEVATSAFVAATGNNLIVSGDMTRRTLLCTLDPRVERPELRTFRSEPVSIAKADRGRYVVAALTILIAYRIDGLPAQAAPLGSFEGWSRLVRNALMWLGKADPVDTLEKTRALDPKLDELSAVLTQWRAVIGSERITVRKLIEQATKQEETYSGAKGDFVHPDFREALLAVAGQGGAVNTRRLGRWLSLHAKRIVDGRWIEQCGLFEGLMTWRLHVDAAV